MFPAAGGRPSPMVASRDLPAPLPGARQLGWLLLAVVFCTHGWQCVAGDDATTHRGHVVAAMSTALPVEEPALVAMADDATMSHSGALPTSPPMHPLAVHLALFVGAMAALVLLALRPLARITRVPPRRPTWPFRASTPPRATLAGRHTLTLLCVSRT